MYELPWQRSPANRAEQKLLCRMYRVFATLETLEESLRQPRPGLARDLRGVNILLQCLTTSIETQLHRPRRLRVWEDSETMAKQPPASMPLFRRSGKRTVRHEKGRHGQSPSQNLRS